MSKLAAKLPSFDAFNGIFDRIASLPERDRRALQALSLFLLGCILYGLFAFHQYAGKIEKNAMTAQNDLFWMRSQAPFIKADNQASTQSLQELVNQKGSQLGMSVKVAESGESAQLSVSHKNAAVLGNFLASLASEGIVFERLAINQQSNMDVQAEATIRKAS